MVGRSPKNPRQPPQPLTRYDEDVVDDPRVLWRIYRAGGRHAVAWNGFRTFGPLPSARFDPHPPRRGEHPEAGVAYAAHDVTTCVAEVFQSTRTVTITADIHLVSWAPIRPLRLLNLSGDWALRNGGSHSLFAAPNPTCRAWSRAIHRTWPDVDGLLFPSTMTGDSAVALFGRAADALPRRPAFVRPLNTPHVWILIADAARRIGYTIQ